MTILLCAVILLAITIVVYIRQPKFGESPRGERLEQLRQSPNYRDGQFQNLHFTASFTGKESPAKMFWGFLFDKPKRTVPEDVIVSVKTDLKNLAPDENILVWFGHSSYFIQLNGIKFLIDPVFSENASPVPNTNKSFKGSNAYSAEDMPEIDYLLITHDHYDHLDYPTVRDLRPKIKHIVCGLGVGAHFERWKYAPSIITEKDWNENMALEGNVTLHTTPARHFSGRSFKRNNTLWLAFILQTDDTKLFLGGDGGYDTHFAQIGERFGGFDLAILENGQYNEAWQHIHLFPEEGLQAAKDLLARRLMPVHSAKFKLSDHPWDEPLITITALNEKDDEPIPLVTPKIGEIVFLNDSTQEFSQWWNTIR